MVQHGYCPRGPFCAFAHVESKYYNSSALVLILLYLEIKYLRNVRTSLDLIKPVKWGIYTRTFIYVYVPSLKISTLLMHEFYVTDDLCGIFCKLNSFIMGFECHPGHVETVMHERYDIMTKVANMRVKRILQPCGAFSANFNEVSNRLKLGTHKRSFYSDASAQAGFCNFS